MVKSPLSWLTASLPVEWSHRGPTGRRVKVKTVSFNHTIGTKQTPFESLITELETIVARLDSAAGLEESLALFERGMTLAKAAETRLLELENQFTRLQVKFGGEKEPAAASNTAEGENERPMAGEPESAKEVDRHAPSGHRG